jgi:hypothetical protein
MLCDGLGVAQFSGLLGKSATDFARIGRDETKTVEIKLSKFIKEINLTGIGRNPGLERRETWGSRFAPPRLLCASPCSKHVPYKT